MLKHCVRMAVLIGLLLFLESDRSLAKVTSVLIESPIRNIFFTVPEDRLDDFVGRLRKFADTHGFAIHVGHPGRDKKHFFVQMWSEEVKIRGRNPFSRHSTEFSVSFYETCPRSVPGYSFPMDFVDTLAKNLKQSVGAIPGVSIDKDEVVPRKPN